RRQVSASRRRADRAVALGHLRVARPRRRLASGHPHRRGGAASIRPRGVSDHTADLDLARELALLGGGIAHDRYMHHPPATRKGDGTWVTEADVAAEEAIRARLAEARPGHNVLGEEDGLHAARGGEAVAGAPA